MNKSIGTAGDIDNDMDKDHNMSGNINKSNIDESPYLGRARELRGDPSRHFNCAQSVFIPFAEATGMDMETAARIGANFGSGMKMGSVCGAITGGLMALGLLGLDDAATVSRYYGALRASHDGTLDCAGLLKKAVEVGIEKKPHCDGMVYECVALVEELMS